MEVLLHYNSVTAYMLGKHDREIAVRIWELAPEHGGILRNCHCEKGKSCRADGMVLRPLANSYIETQLRTELAAFAEEYQLPPQKIHYNRVSALNGEPYGVKRFNLFGLWKNEAALSDARERFDRL